MNICRNGRVDGMSMNEPFFNGQLRLIRPLMLVEKKYIRQAARQWGLPVWANARPRRAEPPEDMAQTLEHLYAVTKDGRRCVLNGLTRWQLEKSCSAAHKDAEDEA